MNPILSIGQINQDSLRQIWENSALSDSLRYEAINEYYDDYAFIKPDSVISLSKFHFSLAEAKEEKLEMAKALNNKAISLYVLGEFDSSMNVMRSALEIRYEIGDSLGIAIQSCNLGNIYFYKSHYVEAVDCFVKALYIYEEKEDSLHMAEALNNLAAIYLKIKDYKQALHYLNRAIKLYHNRSPDEQLATMWLNLGVICKAKGEYRVSIDYYYKALKVWKKKQQLNSIAFCYRSLSIAFEDLNINDSAVYYSERSLELNQEIGSKEGVIYNLISLGRLAFHENLLEATEKGEEAFKLAQNRSNKSLKEEIYRLLYRCYKKQGKYEEAIKMLELYKIYSDSILGKENQIAITRQSIRREFENELYEVQLKNEREQHHVKIKELRDKYLLMGFGIILIGLILVYTRYKVVSHANQKSILLKEIESLKKQGNNTEALQPNQFQLNRNKLEKLSDRKINETDWKVLNVLLADPVISNKDIAEKIFMSIDGIGSSLRRMYEQFQIKESKYKKISLLMEVIKLSNA